MTKHLVFLNQPAFPSYDGMVHSLFNSSSHGKKFWHFCFVRGKNEKHLYEMFFSISPSPWPPTHSQCLLSIWKPHFKKNKQVIVDDVWLTGQMLTLQPSHQAPEPLVRPNVAGLPSLLWPSISSDLFFVPLAFSSNVLRAPFSSVSKILINGRGYFLQHAQCYFTMFHEPQSSSHR